MKKKDKLQVLSYTDEPMLVYQITNELELLDSIDTIERYIRSSIEYRGWIVSKKYKHNQTICKALNIDTNDYDRINVEQDHFPIGLFDIVWIVGTKLISQLKDNDYLTTFDIASQVIKEHLDDQHIGSIALTTTHHQMRHEGIQKIKLEDIHGDYKSFLKKYEGFIPEPVQKRINENLKI
jgi:hypothetical protein